MGASIKTPMVVGEGYTQILIISDSIVFNVPINRIVNEHIDLTKVDYKVTQGKVIFKGSIKKDVIYKGPPNEFNEGTIRYHEESYKFGAVVEIKGVQNGDVCEFKMDSKGCGNFFIHEKVDKDGNILTGSQEIIINLHIKVTREQELNVNF